MASYAGALERLIITQTSDCLKRPNASDQAHHLGASTQNTAKTELHRLNPVGTKLVISTHFSLSWLLCL